MFGNDNKDLFASNPTDAFSSSSNRSGFGSPDNGYDSGFGSTNFGGYDNPASPSHGSGFSTHIDGAAGYGAPPSYGGNQGSVSDYGDRNNHYQDGYGGHSTILDTATNPKDIMNPDQGNNYGNTNGVQTQDYGNNSQGTGSSIWSKLKSFFS